MSSTVIPKEQLSAYQRWEMASFGDDRQSPATQQNAAVVAKQAAEEVERQREEARQQAYAQGLEEGRAAGLAQGRMEAARETERIRRIADNFHNEITRADESVTNDMLDLALDLAKAMLKTALKVRPELVVPVVGEAIRYLPSVQQPALLVLNPQDVPLIVEHMKDELDKAGWRIVEDPQVERGGCRVETASNQVDANTPVRWQRIADALGKQSDWLA